MPAEVGFAMRAEGGGGQWRSRAGVHMDWCVAGRGGGGRGEGAAGRGLPCRLLGRCLLPRAGADRCSTPQSPPPPACTGSTATRTCPRAAVASRWGGGAAAAERLGPACSTRPCAPQQASPSKHGRHPHPAPKCRSPPPAGRVQGQAGLRPGGGRPRGHAALCTGDAAGAARPPPLPAACPGPGARSLLWRRAATEGLTKTCSRAYPTHARLCPPPHPPPPTPQPPTPGHGVLLGVRRGRHLLPLHDVRGRHLGGGRGGGGGMAQARGYPNSGALASARPGRGPPCFARRPDAPARSSSYSPHVTSPASPPQLHSPFHLLTGHHHPDAAGRGAAQGVGHAVRAAADGAGAAGGRAARRGRGGRRTRRCAGKRHGARQPAAAHSPCAQATALQTPAAATTPTPRIPPPGVPRQHRVPQQARRRRRGAVRRPPPGV
jgi:hypothetical protein